MNKARLEAFTDAIIAIAATIMVLELQIPKEPTFRGLLGEWQTLLAYVISFVYIYVVWFSHHNIFKKATVITTRTFLYNGVWLFLLTLVPFTTKWVGSETQATSQNSCTPSSCWCGVWCLRWWIGKSYGITRMLRRTRPIPGHTGWHCTVALSWQWSRPSFHRWAACLSWHWPASSW